MKYSILMPYFSRINQLANTLLSFSVLYGARNDYEIIIVVDAKNTAQDVEDLQAIVIKYLLSAMSITLLFFKDKQVINPAPLYNVAAENASGQFLILTSPEVFHTVDILGVFDTVVADNTYVVCSCLHTDGHVPVAIVFQDLLKYKMKRWYQHSIHRPANYHFCSVLSKKLFNAIGGFDDTYGYGHSYDDDDFRDRVLSHPDTQLIIRDDLLTVHQCHDKNKAPKHLLQRNREHYEGNKRRMANG